MDIKTRPVNTRKSPSPAKRKKIMVDWAMGTSFLFLAVPAPTSRVVHISVGAIFFALASLHIYQHRNWFKALRKGKWSKKRIERTALDLLPALFLAITIALGAGMAASGDISWSAPLSEGGSNLSHVHHWLAIASLVACILHVNANRPKH